MNNIDDHLKSCREDADVYTYTFTKAEVDKINEVLKSGELMDRDCNNCVYSTRDGGCKAWECKGNKTVDDIRAKVIAEISREMQMLYGNEYEQKIRKDTLTELWGKAIYMHDEYIEYEELDNIIDEMIKEHK